MASGGDDETTSLLHGGGAAQQNNNQDGDGVGTTRQPLCYMVAEQRSKTTTKMEMVRHAGLGTISSDRSA